MKLHAMEHAFAPNSPLGLGPNNPPHAANTCLEHCFLSSTLVAPFVDSHYCSRHAFEASNIILTNRRQSIGEANIASGVGPTTAPDTLCITG